MATRKHSVKGKAMWAKVFETNGEVKDYLGQPHPFGKLFKIDLVLDKENKALYKSSGTAGKGKFDDDGNFIAPFVVRRRRSLSGLVVSLKLLTPMAQSLKAA